MKEYLLKLNERELELITKALFENYRKAVEVGDNQTAPTIKDALYKLSDELQALYEKTSKYIN